MSEIAVKVVNRSGTIPSYKTAGAAGADLSSAQELILMPGQYRAVDTGLSFEIPEDYECQIRARSGLAANHGVTVLNGVGTVDSDFRGNVKVILINHGQLPFAIRKGDRIAQAVFAPVTRATFVEAENLSETERGEGGFGSTGVSLEKVIRYDCGVVEKVYNMPDIVVKCEI